MSEDSREITPFDWRRRAREDRIGPVSRSPVSKPPRRSGTQEQPCFPPSGLFISPTGGPHGLSVGILCFSDRSTASLERGFNLPTSDPQTYRVIFVKVCQSMPLQEC